MWIKSSAPWWLSQPRVKARKSDYYASVCCLSTVVASDCAQLSYTISFPLIENLKKEIKKHRLKQPNHRENYKEVSDLI